MSVKDMALTAAGIVVMCLFVFPVYFVLEIIGGIISFPFMVLEAGRKWERDQFKKSQKRKII